ncbi:MAG: hypothetical protein HWD60_16365 [Defluviicoccus sp.]|nr:MAG: hypothetical protein HWD60_16365 [Defluviicoccus sp.]
MPLRWLRAAANPAENMVSLLAKVENPGILKPAAEWEQGALSRDWRSGKQAPSA